MATPYRRIMLTLDGSDFALMALSHAQELARCFGAHLILYQAVADTTKPETPVAIPELVTTRTGVPISSSSLVVETAQQMLDNLAAELRLQGVDAQVVIETGPPAERIIDHAREHDVDLIVMSTHGRTGLARWVYGSVADQVLRHAHCPVLLVHVGGHAG